MLSIMTHAVEDSISQQQHHMTDTSSFQETPGTPKSGTTGAADISVLYQKRATYLQVCADADGEMPS